MWFFLFVLSVSLVMAQHVTETFTNIQTLSPNSRVEYGTDYIFTCSITTYTTTDINFLENSTISMSVPFNTVGPTVCDISDLAFVYGNSTHVAFYEMGNETSKIFEFGGSDIVSGGFNVGGSRYVACDRGTGAVLVFTTNETDDLDWYQVEVTPGLENPCVSTGFTTSPEGETLVVLDNSNILGIWTVDDESDDIEYISSQNITVTGGTVDDLVTAWNDHFYIKYDTDSDFFKYGYGGSSWDQQEEYNMVNTKLWAVGRNDGTLVTVDTANDIRVVHDSGAVVVFDDVGKPAVVNSISVFDFTEIVLVDGNDNLVHVATSYYTDAPTTSPTGAPTTSPTGSPTGAPTTGSPTGAPTTSPTLSPIIGVSPTGSPTRAPTTRAPTTANPTRAPITIPPTTAIPTPKPTESTEITPTTIALIAVSAILGIVVVWELSKRTSVNYGARAF